MEQGSGLLVFIMIVCGGIQYTISARNTGLISDARDRIFQAILGMLLLFLSYIILNTINPDLISLREPNVDSVFLPNIPPAKTQQQLDAEYNARRATEVGRIDQEAIDAEQRLTTIREQMDNETDPEKLAELKQQEDEAKDDYLNNKYQQSITRLNEINSRIETLETKQGGWANRSWYNPAKWGSGVVNGTVKPWTNWWEGGSFEGVGADGLTRAEEIELAGLRYQSGLFQRNVAPTRQGLQSIRKP